MTEADATFSTFDLNTAAFLATRGYVLRAARVAERGVLFEFDSVARTVADDYVLGAHAPARAFAAAQRDMKALVARALVNPTVPIVLSQSAQSEVQPTN